MTNYLINDGQVTMKHISDHLQDVTQLYTATTADILLVLGATPSYQGTAPRKKHDFSPLTPTVVICVQLQSIMCWTGLSHTSFAIFDIQTL